MAEERKVGVVIEVTYQAAGATTGLVDVTMYRCAHRCISYTAEEYDELGGELYCDECDGDRFFKTLLFMVEGDRHV